jgi:hypothetical protein
MVYPLAALKILAIVAIWSKASAFLKEWAYAGFFINFSLALAAHLQSGDGQFFGSIIALVFLVLSYLYDRKIFPNKQLDIRK